MNSTQGLSKNALSLCQGNIMAIVVLRRNYYSNIPPRSTQERVAPNRSTTNKPTVVAYQWSFNFLVINSQVIAE